MKANIAGSGNFHGFNLQAIKVTVSVTGSGDAEVVSIKILEARVFGSGNIKYKGTPEKKNIKISGSGSISN